MMRAGTPGKPYHMKPPFESVVFQPQVFEGLLRGTNQIVSAIRPTLGPLPRYVAIERKRSKTTIRPEVLDDGALIARRIIQIENRDDDVGAMYIRNVLWRLRETVGDGTATAAVIYQSILKAGVRYIVAGGDPMRMRRHFENGLRIILQELDQQTRPLEEGKEQLALIARTICYDKELANLLGEIFDIIGEFGRLEIRTGRGIEHDREYVEGSYWNGGVLSRHFLSENPKLRVHMENAHILISDLDINEPAQIAHVMEVALAAKISALVIVANKLSESVLATVLSNQGKDKPLRILGVRSPSAARGEDSASALEDLVILTGGRPFHSVTSESLLTLKPDDFGKAGKVWADRQYFGVVSGKADPHLLRQHILRLRNAYKKTSEQDARERLQKRVGKLMGGSATLWIGGHNEVVINERKDWALRTATSLRGAIRDGVMPGGGISLLACRPALESQLDGASTPDERAAYNILLTALEVPARTILSNAGYNLAEKMYKISTAPAGFGFDVNTGEMVDLFKAGILDLAATQKAVVQAAVTSAALALTVETIVHHKTPDLALIPK